MGTIIVRTREILARVKEEAAGREGTDPALECFHTALDGVLERGLEELSLAQAVRLRKISAEVAAMADNNPGSLSHLRLRQEPLARWLDEELGVNEADLEEMAYRLPGGLVEKARFQRTAQKVLYARWQKDVEQERCLM